MRGRLVLRPVEIGADHGPNAKLGGGTAYRIEWADGVRTGCGLFVSQRTADQYAAAHGWPRPMRVDLTVPPVTVVEAGAGIGLAAESSLWEADD